MSAFYPLSVCASRNDHEVVDAKNSGAYTLLFAFFGVTSAEIQRDGRIRCTFVHSSADGLSSETRNCFISEENTPEKNMQILATARREQAWYQKMRNDAQAIEPTVGLVNPTVDAVDEELLELPQ